MQLEQLSKCRQIYMGNSWYHGLKQTEFKCWHLFFVYTMKQLQIKVAFSRALFWKLTRDITVTDHKCHTFVTRS